MSKTQRTEQAFFATLHDYNTTSDDACALKVGLIATLMGNASVRHVGRYYPECARG